MCLRSLYHKEQEGYRSSGYGTHEPFEVLRPARQAQVLVQAAAFRPHGRVWYVTTDDTATWTAASRLGAYAPQPVQVDTRMLEGVNPTKILVRGYPAGRSLAYA